MAGDESRPVLGLRIFGNISRNAFDAEFEDGRVDEGVAYRYRTELVLDLRLPTSTVIAAGLPFVQQRGRVRADVPQYNGDAVGDAWIEVIHGWTIGLGYIGGAVRGTVPTGNEDFTMGTGAVHILAEVIAGYPIGDFLGAVSVGYRAAQLFGLSERSAGDEFVYRVAGQYDIWRRLVFADLAVVGATAIDPGLIDSRFSDAGSPVELEAGTRWRFLGPSALLRAGVGFGLNRGQGTPLARFFLGLEFACVYGECLSGDRTPSDADDDGVPDIQDDCPQAVEDRDGFEDADGCPDPDNDNDRIPDEADRCPKDAEDRDGFEDADGCPEPDNDGDYVLDSNDRCPLEAEDSDGFQDQDGCPERDNDLDGIVDEQDECRDYRSPRMQELWRAFSSTIERQPNRAKRDEIEARLKSSKEDVDGFEDQDGCPDYDHDYDGWPEWDDRCPDAKGHDFNQGCPAGEGDDADGDGIPNFYDACPLEPETRNGFVDEDGCPDAFFEFDFARQVEVNGSGVFEMDTSGEQDELDREYAGQLGEVVARIYSRISSGKFRLEVAGGVGQVPELHQFYDALLKSGVKPEEVDTVCNQNIDPRRRFAVRLCRPKGINERRPQGMPQHTTVCLMEQFSAEATSNFGCGR